jgi:hypothetical protein
LNCLVKVGLQAEQTLVIEIFGIENLDDALIKLFIIENFVHIRSGNASIDFILDISQADAQELC